MMSMVKINRVVLEKGRGALGLLGGALVLTLMGWVIGQGGGGVAQADNGGAASGGLITMMGVMQGSEHLYLIDTASGTIMMYQADNNKDLVLMAGRSYQADAHFLTRIPDRSLPFRSGGYSAKEVAELLKKFP